MLPFGARRYAPTLCGNIQSVKNGPAGNLYNVLPALRIAKVLHIIRLNHVYNKNDCNKHCGYDKGPLIEKFAGLL